MQKDRPKEMEFNLWQIRGQRVADADEIPLTRPLQTRWVDSVETSLHEVSFRSTAPVQVVDFTQDG